MPESDNLNTRYPSDYPLEQIQKFKAKQSSISAEVRRYEKAGELKDQVTFLSPFRALVPSSDPEKPYFVKFRKEFEGDVLDCECTSFMFGVVPDPDFQCKHLIAASEKWDEVNK